MESMATSASSKIEYNEKLTIRKISVRLIPFLLLAYLLNSIDKANISIAALKMNADLRMTPTEFGFGSSVFFFGSLVFEMPIAILTQRFGGRKAIGTMLLLWGLLASATGYVYSVQQFYLVRTLLGVAEAGFFPAFLLYLTFWFPSVYRARIIGMTMLALPISSVIGSPISAYLLVKAHGFMGFEGWRWMFIVEGLPATLLGVGFIFLLKDQPSQTAWLESNEAGWLESTLEHERDHLKAIAGFSLIETVRNGSVLLLSITMFLVLGALYGGVFWIPQLLNGITKSNIETGILLIVPYTIAGVAMYWWPRRSDKKREKIMHLVAAVLVSATGFSVTGLWVSSPVIAIIGLSLACMGVYAALPILWSLPITFFTGRAAAGALAMVTTVGYASGVVVPPAIGWSKQITGGFSVAMFGLALSMLLAAAMLLGIRSRKDYAMSTRETFVGDVSESVPAIDDCLTQFGTESNGSHSG